MIRDVTNSKEFAESSFTKRIGIAARICMTHHKTGVVMLLDRARQFALKTRSNERLMLCGCVLAVALVIIGALDVFSTSRGLAAGFVEGNPLVWALQEGMSYWWSFPKMAVHVIMAALILWLPSKRVLAGGALMSTAYMFLVGNNFYLVGWPL